MQKSVTVDQALTFLNEALALDPAAMEKLIESRVPCNEGLYKHPAIQCCGHPLSEHGPAAVGFLGMLNGLFGASERGGGFIAAVYGEDRRLIRFEKLVSVGVHIGGDWKGVSTKGMF